VATRKFVVGLLRCIAPMEAIRRAGDLFHALPFLPLLPNAVTFAMAGGVSYKRRKLTDVVKVVDDGERGRMQDAEREFGGDVGYAARGLRRHDQHGRKVTGGL
jgi:hypothetical protein